MIILIHANTQVSFGSFHEIVLSIHPFNKEYMETHFNFFSNAQQASTVHKQVSKTGAFLTFNFKDLKCAGLVCLYMLEIECLKKVVVGVNGLFQDKTKTKVPRKQTT